MVLACGELRTFSATFPRNSPPRPRLLRHMAREISEVQVCRHVLGRPLTHDAHGDASCRRHFHFLPPLQNSTRVRRSMHLTATLAIAVILTCLCICRRFAGKGSSLMSRFRLRLTGECDIFPPVSPEKMCRLDGEADRLPTWKGA